MTHPDVRANAIDTGFIERELKNLTAGGERPATSNSARLLPPSCGRKAGRARTKPHSPWRTFGWMPVGRRQRLFTFRHGQGAEHAVTLHYGNGPSKLSIGEREFVFASSANDDGGFDLTLDGMKSDVIAVIEGHELYLRTRNGRFDLHWVDPFGGDDEEQVGEDKIVAPLPGTVVALLAEVGATPREGRADPDAGSDEDGADPARAVRRRAEGDQMQGRRLSCRQGVELRRVVEPAAA